MRTKEARKVGRKEGSIASKDGRADGRKEWKNE